MEYLVKVQWAVDFNIFDVDLFKDRGGKPIILGGGAE